MNFSPNCMMREGHAVLTWPLPRLTSPPHIIPRKLVLDAQAELLHAAPFLAPSSLEQSHRTVPGYVEVRNSQPRMLCDHLPSLDASVSGCRADSDG